jgi:hypothetical protein
MLVTVKKLELSNDGSTYETILPIEEKFHTVEGKEPFPLDSSVEPFSIWSANQSIKFDSNGLKEYHNHDNLQPFHLKASVDGDIITYSDGSTVNTTE